MTQPRRKYLISGLIGLLLLVWVGSRVVLLTRTSRLEIGTRTTFLLGQLSPDETFDFEAALHQRASIGITPENNAAVPLELAFGLADMPFDMRLRYYRYLGMAEPLASGKYVVSQEMFAKQQTGSPNPTGEKFLALVDELSAAQERPWTRAEFPRVSQWIDVNDEPLKLVEQASRRPEFYAPLVSSGPLLEASYTLAQNLRTVSRLLVTRAMVRISDGNLDGAADDLLACHRLAGLLGKNATLIGALTAISMDAMASQGDQVWLAQSPTVEQIHRFQSELQKLPDVTNIAATLDLHERVITLDSMQSFGAGPKAAANGGLLGISRLDINVALHCVNDYYDSLKPNLQHKDIRARREALAKLAEEGKRRAKESVAPLRLAANFIWDSRQTMTTSIAQVMLQLTTPAVAQAQSAEDRSRMRRELLSVACALAIYRAQRGGGYPERLDVLKPGFLKQLPLDRYNNKPLRYQVRPEGYILYSVGPNGKDDGGVPIKGDTGDLSFEVKHPAKPQ